VRLTSVRYDKYADPSTPSSSDGLNINDAMLESGHARVCWP
jgi:hypothetical protein